MLIGTEVFLTETFHGRVVSSSGKIEAIETVNDVHTGDAKETGRVMIDGDWFSKDGACHEKGYIVLGDKHLPRLQFSVE
jgi:hypothetical protein